MGLPQYPEPSRPAVVRDQLKEIGITMDIEQVDVSVWFDRFVKGDTRSPAPTRSGPSTGQLYSLVLLSGAPINTTFY